LPARQAAGDRSVWALACHGGDVIVQALSQVILNCTLTRMTLQQAVEAVFDVPGAFAPHSEAERLLFAEDRIEPHVLRQLAERGHDVRRWPGFEFDSGSELTVNYADIIADFDHEIGPGALAGRGVMSAAADPRRSAYAHVR
jgi:gamma-glutamyltranspeptidase / glutathione hydrolase